MSETTETTHVMFHNEIPYNQRQQYLELLAHAEAVLPSLSLHPEHLQIVSKAASAVRGSEDVLRRIKTPVTLQHIATLSDMLRKSRIYVNNFWGVEETVAAPSIPMPTAQIQAPAPLCVETSAAPDASTTASASSFPLLAKGKDALPNPQHLSQYLPTLSEKLQRQATVLSSIYAELNDKHETLDRLVRSSISAHAAHTVSMPDSKEISYYANCVNNIVNTIDAFWLRVHAERQAKDGKPITQEYQRFLDDLERKYPMEVQMRKWCDYSKAEIEQLEISFSDPNVPIFPDMPDSPTIAQLIYARQDRNKRIIRRKPQHLNETSRQERILAMNELHEWGICIERKQRDALTAMGIDVPNDFLNPSLNMTEDEKCAKRRETRRIRYEQNNTLERKLKIAKKQRMAKQEDNPYKIK